MAGFYSLMVVSMRTCLRTKIPESQRKRGTKVLVLSHTRGCWLQLPLLYIMSELTVFCGWKAASPPSPPRPPVMSTGRDFTLKRDSSGNEENVEFGWKIPNGFWVKWFLSFCLVGKVTSPTAPLKLRGSPCWGHVRQPTATGGSRKAITSMKCGSLSTQVDILGNRLCSSSRWDEQQALCHGWHPSHLCLASDYSGVGSFKGS